MIYLGMDDGRRHPHMANRQNAHDAGRRLTVQVFLVRGLEILRPLDYAMGKLSIRWGNRPVGTQRESEQRTRNDQGQIPAMRTT